MTLSSRFNLSLAEASVGGMSAESRCSLSNCASLKRSSSEEEEEEEMTREMLHVPSFGMAGCESEVEFEDEDERRTAVVWMARL